MGLTRMTLSPPAVANRLPPVSTAETAGSKSSEKMGILLCQWICSGFTFILWAGGGGGGSIGGGKDEEEEEKECKCQLHWWNGRAAPLTFAIKDNFVYYSILLSWTTSGPNEDLET